MKSPEVLKTLGKIDRCLHKYNMAKIDAEKCYLSELDSIQKELRDNLEFTVSQIAWVEAIIFRLLRIKL